VLRNGKSETSMRFQDLKIFPGSNRQEFRSRKIRGGRFANRPYPELLGRGSAGAAAVSLFNSRD